MCLFQLGISESSLPAQFPLEETESYFVFKKTDLFTYVQTGKMIGKEWGTAGGRGLHADVQVPECNRLRNTFSYPLS